MLNADWLGKPYYSLDAYFKNTYGEKCYKLAVDAGFTCPNRDGSLGTGGCIFCSEGGSGDFADGFGHTDRASGRKSIDKDGDAAACHYDTDHQIKKGLERFDKTVGKKFVIYFQAYTNTYGYVKYLRKIYTEALSNENVIGISIATRPDCLGNDILCLLLDLKEKYKDKFIWIELGLQTIHEETATYIRRHYSLDVFEAAIKKLGQLNIPFITHIILGLPNETEEMMLETVKYVSDMSIKYAVGNGETNEVKTMAGIKLQLLHVLEGTDLSIDYAKGNFNTLEQEEYIDLVIKCLQHIDERIVIHRVTGDGPKKILIAPKWSGNKKAVLNALHKRMKELGARQGDKL